MHFAKKRNLATYLSLSCLAYFLLFHGTALFLAGGNLSQYAERLSFLDSAWYLHLAQNGYVESAWESQNIGSQFAFFPLWVLVVKALFTSSILASIVASLFFFSVVRFCLRNRQASFVGLLVLLLCPGSFSFFSNHTESIFLCLSFFALYFAGRQNLVLASVLAGLCALTKNQGVITAVIVGLMLAGSQRRLGRSLWQLTLSGIISGGLFSLWLLFQYLQTGNALAFIEAQKYWQVSSGLVGYIKNIFWISPGNWQHASVFWLCVIGSFTLLRNRDRKIKLLGLYVLLCVLLWPMQGHSFKNAYRYGAPMFPIWFLLGDSMTQRLKPTAIGIILVAMACFSGMNAYIYLTQSGWPY